MKLLGIIAIAIACAQPAFADGKTDARAHVQVADTAYKLGKFADALAEYTKAYELFPAAPLLFNIGQCHRNLKNHERAIFFYQGYLRESPPDAPNRAVVEDLIRESQSDLAKQQAADADAKRAADAARERSMLEEARLRAEAEAQRRRDEDRRIAEARRQVPDREAAKPIYKKWWFWSAVGGVTVAAAGGTLYYLSGDTRVVAPTGSLGGLDRR